MAFQRLLFYGMACSDFVALKIRFGLQSTTQIHHIIPREFRAHSCLKNLHIDDGCNLMLMPNRKGKGVIDTSRPVHDGGHLAYNRYVGAQLDLISLHDEEDVRDVYVTNLIESLRQRVRGQRDLPWRDSI